MTRAKADRAAPGLWLCLATHHKTGTIWMRRTLQAIAGAQGIPIHKVARLAKLEAIPRDGPRLLVHWDGAFPRPLFGDPDARILHVIRDPRDVLLSGMRYHLTASPARERFLGRRGDSWGGKTYQEHLRALPGLVPRLAFEMTEKHHQTVEEMLSWHFGRANTIELRYETLMTHPDGTPFRDALEQAGIVGLDIDDAMRCFIANSLFGGLSTPDARAGLSGHVISGAPERWRSEMPIEIARPYAARYGAALRILGYAESDEWVDGCRPAAEIEADAAFAHLAAE
jgi:hypothetical protein